MSDIVVTSGLADEAVRIVAKHMDGQLSGLVVLAVDADGVPSVTHASPTDAPEDVKRWIAEVSRLLDQLIVESTGAQHAGMSSGTWKPSAPEDPKQ